MKCSKGHYGIFPGKQTCIATVGYEGKCSKGHELKSRALATTCQECREVVVLTAVICGAGPASRLDQANNQ